MARKNKEELELIRAENAKIAFDKTKAEYAPRLQTALMKLQAMQLSNVSVNFDATGVVFHLYTTINWNTEWKLRYNFTEYEDLYELEGLENYIRSYEEELAEKKRKSELYKNAISKLSDEEIQLLKERLNGH